jgi:uncharacterized membrane protein
MIPTNTLSAPSGRYDLIDALRGTALIGMVVYHVVWDLALTGFARPSLPLDAHWTLLARVTAASFLVLVGVGLVLAGDRGLASARFLRRLGLVGGAAALVSLATWLAFPAQFVFFGILHHIVVASVLALPFRRAPIALVLFAALVALALPLLMSDARFDHPALRWLGLGQQNFSAVDFVPLFPWFGAVLAGMAVARLVNAPDAAWTRWRADVFVARLLVWSGRRSLWIYLVHQPLLLAVLLSLSALLGA